MQRSESDQRLAQIEIHLYSYKHQEVRPAQVWVAARLHALGDQMVPCFREKQE